MWWSLYFAYMTPNFYHVCIFNIKFQKRLDLNHHNSLPRFSIYMLYIVSFMVFFTCVVIYHTIYLFVSNILTAVMWI
jgi:hypothetical protein